MDVISFPSLNDTDIQQIVARKLRELGVPVDRDCVIQAQKASWQGVAGTIDDFVVRIRYSVLKIVRPNGQQLHPTTEHRLQEFSKRTRAEVVKWCEETAEESLALLEAELTAKKIPYPQGFPRVDFVRFFGPDRRV